VSRPGNVRFHPLSIRPDDDDPDAYVVGRPAGGEYVVLPHIAVEAIRLLDDGRRVDDVEAALAQDGVVPDVAELVEALAELGFVATIDHRPVVGPPGGDPTGAVASGGTAGGHLARLTGRHVAWLFSRRTVAGYAVLLAAAAWTVWRHPDLLPGYRDFFWHQGLGLVVVVNTALFLANAMVHEFMHLAAARSVGVPARIGLGTRLTYLALQTDVSAAWTVPRRLRYRIYLAGLYWDSAVVATTLLVLAYAGPGPTVDGVLRAYVLVVATAMAMQAQVYMRTDLYFVLLDLLRSANLFHDAKAYVHYGLRRIADAVRRRPAPPSPLRHLLPRERRAVRAYTPLLVAGTATVLTVAALYMVPVFVETLARSFRAVAAVRSGGSVLAALDGGLVLLVQVGVQTLFLVTFVRTHRGWFRRTARKRPPPTRAPDSRGPTGTTPERG
jgi:putative peptide zinc metalloprotease protein